MVEPTRHEFLDESELINAQHIPTLVNDLIMWIQLATHWRAVCEPKDEMIQRLTDEADRLRARVDTLEARERS